MNINKIAGVILAAGKGTRMHSPMPKAMHPILGSPMLAYVRRALEAVVENNIFIVIGHGAAQIKTAFPNENFIMQSEQLGTGHALQIALSTVKNFEYIIVVNGDSPAVTSKTIQNFMDAAMDCDLAFASIELDDPASYGRVMRKNGRLTGIVEARDLENPECAPKEINTGLYLFKVECVQRLLPKLNCANRSGEYYITDLIALGLNDNMDVRAIQCGHDENLLGVNSPGELIQTEEIMKERVNRQLLRNGVIIHSPASVMISTFARIAKGVEIYGPCEIFGMTQIGRGTRIEFNSSIRDCLIGENVIIRPFSHLENAIIGDEAIIGPYTRLRPQAEIGAGAHVGNFVEIKKTSLGEFSKANHLSYLGDAQIGRGVNIGAGTITCNYDGQKKHPTVIHDEAFIGSNSSLVAPVEIGAASLVGAGSVITQNVPNDALAIARGCQKNMPRRDIKNK